MGFVRRPDCDLDLRQISACTHNRQTHNTLSRLGCGFDSAGNRHESSTKQWHGQATGGMKEREETRRPRSALRGWLPNTAKVSGGCKAVDKREKRATRRGRVYVASLGPFRYSSGSTALGRWRVRQTSYPRQTRTSTYARRVRRCSNTWATTTTTTTTGLQEGKWATSP